METLKPEEWSCDLLVIGGGPAGTSAAITAARAGVNVALLEKGTYPRHKVCGEFISGESVQLLNSLLANSLETRSLLSRPPRIAGARLFLDGRTVHAPVDPPAASVARFDLDAALWRAAVSAGVDARSGTSVTNVQGHGPFDIQTSAGNMTARAVINTTGRWSNLTERPNTGSSTGSAPKWIGVKAHYSEASPASTTDLYFFDGGYCGVQPVGLGEESATARIVVCSMMRSDVASRLEDVFPLEPRLKDRSRHWKRLSDPVSTSPLIFRQPDPEKHGILFAGDAAGFVDPFVGDGISLALRSGAMAAESLLGFFCGQATLDNAAAKYRSEYEERLLPIFQTSSLLRRMLALPAAVRKPLLRIIESFPAATRLMVKNTR